MLKKPEKAWAIVNRDGTLALFDGRAPIYWLRRVAIEDALDQGFCMSGRDPDVRICRVLVRQFS